MVKDLLIFFFSGLMLLGCMTPPDDRTNTVLVMTVDTAGVDGTKSDICAGFTLTDSQAQSYFYRSIEISAKEMHDQYDYLPCYVRGKCEIYGKACEWEIRAGGTASVDTSSDHYLFGCKNCF